MAKYRDGTEARIGDLVKGHGYLVSDEKGAPALVVGTVVALKPDQLISNIQVAHVLVTLLPADFLQADPNYYLPRQLIHASYDETGAVTGQRECRLNIEHGQSDMFEKIG